MIAGGGGTRGRPTSRRNAEHYEGNMVAMMLTQILVVFRLYAMLTASDFQVQKVVASGFIGSGEFNPASAMRFALANWPDIYDGEAMSIPSPDAIPDFPAVTLSSKNGSWLIEMSKARVNVAWLRQDAKKRSMERLFSNLSQRLVAVLEDAGVSAGRLAALVTRVAPVENPGTALAKQFCKRTLLDGPLNRPEGFELHAHKTFTLHRSLEVNSWVRIKTAKAGTRDYRYVIVEHDLNTLASELDTRKFTGRETGSMFRASANEMQAILDLYFP